MLWKGFQKPKRLEVDKDGLSDNFGRFTAQPFERGFAPSGGNALRRVLLSSIEGAAITAVRVEGVLHEFSPIPGAMEDTTDLILNLKRVPLKMNVEHPKTLMLKSWVRGGGADTLCLIPSLKGVPIKMHVDHPKTLILKTSVPGEVRAKDITPDPD